MAKVLKTAFLLLALVLLASVPAVTSALTANSGGASRLTAQQAAPSVSISASADAQVRLNSPVLVMATFSEPVSGFTVDDISVGNGTASGFSGSDGDAVYTFDVTPTSLGEVTVDIAADVATDGDGGGNTEAPRLSLGIPYDFDGNGGISKNEAIAAVVDYFAGRITKAQTIAVIVLYFSAPAEPGPGDDCIEAVSIDGTVNGQWASGCDSETRSGSHARYYTFTLDASSEVTVRLESSAANTYLYLRREDATSGTALHENDDHQGSTSISQIQETLPAGSYTIEATTSAAGETGGFTLTVSRSVVTTPPPDADVLATEHAALVALYDATGGADWQNNTGWRTDAPVGDWFGITTYERGFVDEIRLPDNGLAGPLPPELADIRYLRVLVLGTSSYTCTGGVCQPDSDNGNRLTGPIPDGWIRLNDLRTFNLAANPLTGPFPQWTRWYRELEHLDLSGAQLTGTIPARLGNLTQMQHLDLSNNQLSGPVPTRLGNLARLRHLALDNNQLTGPVPLELSNLLQLTTLRLSGNQLTGCVPAELNEVAANDLANLNLPDCALDTSDPVDRAALVAFYEATGGPHWTNSSGWLSGAPIGEWYGVTANSAGRVTRLVLPSNQLSGTLPLDIGLLTQLQTLALESNALTGELPLTLNYLTELTAVFLDGNQFTGCVPYGVTAGMVDVNLGFCDFPQFVDTGSAEGDRAALVALYNATDGDNWANRDGWLTSAPLYEWYGVRASQFDGRVNSISLTDNGLNGALPPELGDLTALSLLKLGTLNYSCRRGVCRPSSETGNQLTGPIPEELRNLTRLNFLHLAANPLTGELPSWLGDLWGMSFLTLGGTQLTGPIPEEWSGLSRLTELRLGGNQLSGQVPAWLGMLPDLGSLDLAGNQLAGDIPVSLSRLTALDVLWLSANELTGRIPPEFGRLTNLNSLFLNYNNLTGRIPPELGNLANLEKIYLANNDFSGCVPAALQGVETNDFDDVNLPFCEP